MSSVNPIIIAVLILILLLGVILAFLSFRKSKKEEGYSVLLFTSGMSLTMSSSSSTLDKILVGIGIITKYENASALGGDFNFWYFALGVVLIAISILMFVNAKRKLYILNINAYMPKRIEDFFKGLKMTNFEFKEREIDIIRIYKRMFSVRLDDESFECIKDEIKQKIEAFKNETKDIKRGYTGIAPIPFIIYAGTFLERTKIDSYYEFDKIDTQTYYKLTEGNNVKFSQLKINTDIDNLNQSKSEVVLAISLTQPITAADLCQFRDLEVINMGIDTPKDNAIRSKEQLYKYNKMIFETIEKLGKRLPNLRAIHLVYSGQSCLPLEMGKRSVDDTRLPQIISYQYERQSSIKYPWGIVINGQEKGKLVRV
jgi:hypothetical protein